MAGSMGRVAGSAVVVAAAAAAKGIRFMGEEEPQGGWGCEGGVRQGEPKARTNIPWCMCIFWAILLVLFVGVVEVPCFCCCATATWSVCVKKNGQICTPHLSYMSLSSTWSPK